MAITSHEVEGMLDSLLALRRKGLAIILALTHPGPGFDSTAQRAKQIGVQTLQLWSQGALDVWR